MHLPAEHHFVRHPGGSFGRRRADRWFSDGTRKKPKRHVNTAPSGARDNACQGCPLVGCSQGRVL